MHTDEDDAGEREQAQSILQQRFEVVRGVESLGIPNHLCDFFCPNNFTYLGGKTRSNDGVRNPKRIRRRHQEASGDQIGTRLEILLILQLVRYVLRMELLIRYAHPAQ